MKQQQAVAPAVRTDVIHSTEALDFDAWARRLVAEVLAHEGVKVAPAVQPSTTSAA